MALAYEPDADAPFAGDFARSDERIVDDGAEGSIPPPHDLDAEAAVLSAVLVDPAALPKLGALRPEHFYSEAHRRIFEACLALRDAGRPVDVVTVASELRDRDRLGQVGGMAYVTEVLNAAPAIANVTAYAGTVAAKWRARQGVVVADRMRAQMRAGIDADAVMSQATTELGALQHIEASARISVLDGAAIAEPLAPIEALVTEIGLVAGGGAPHLVAGFGFSGKTLAVQALAIALASATPVWAVHRVRDARRVVHVDLEQGERLTRRRYQRLALGMNVELRELGDALSLVVMPPIRLTSGDRARWRSLMSGRDLLIVDSLRAATPGADENASDIRGALDMLGGLSEETGCRAIVVHHARKPGADDPGGRYAIRGSGAIFDAADSAYLFSAGENEPVRVQHVKARSFGEPVADFALVVSDVAVGTDARAGVRVALHGAELVAERREKQAQASREARARGDAEAVRQALRKRPGLGSRELRAVAGLSGDRMSAALAELGEAVEIRDERQGRNVARRHYLRGAA